MKLREGNSPVCGTGVRTVVRFALRVAAARARRALGLFAAVLPASLATGCVLTTPFRGPGFERARGVTASCGGDTVVVGLTHARLDASRRRWFDENRDRIVDGLARHRGFIGYSIRTRIFGDEVWTMTVWCSRADLDAFVASRAHRRGIREGMAAVTAARFARFEVPRAEVPISWERALAELAQHGSSHGYSLERRALLHAVRPTRGQEVP